jgi:hypothetical protein
LAQGVVAVVADRLNCAALERLADDQPLEAGRASSIGRQKLTEIHRRATTSSGFTGAPWLPQLVRS